MEKLEFVYKPGLFKDIEVWDGIAALVKQQEPAAYFWVYDKKVNFLKVPIEINKLNGGGFHVEGDKFDFLMGFIASYKLVFVQIKIKENFENEWYKEWVDALIQLNGFVHAWVVDYEYNYWQNAADPSQYKFGGRSTEGIPMIQSDSPPPWDRWLIDTSSNAGLRKIRKGYIEAIGARMWFSEKFLALINRTIEEIQDAYPCKIEKYTEDVYQLSASVDIFKDSSTEAEQRQLRAALYGNVKQEE